MTWLCPQLRRSLGAWGVGGWHIGLGLSVCSSLTLAYGQEWLELGPWNFIYSISMKNKRTHIYFVCFFLRGSPCGVIIHFRLGHLKTAGGYFVCATTHTVLYQIWNFAGSFIMVYRMRVVLAWSSMLFLSLFFTFEHNHFWCLNTIKVHNRGYLVRATPATVLYRSILKFAGPF